MTEWMLILWVWIVAGCFAFFIRGNRLTEVPDILTTLFLVLAWPVWLSHYKGQHRGYQQQDDKVLVPIRITAREKTRRKE